MQKIRNLVGKALPGVSLMTTTSFPANVGLHRRRFILGSGGLLLSVGTLSLVGCGSDDSSSGSAAPPDAFSIVSVKGLIDLPRGVLPATVTLVTGESELTPFNGTFTASVPGNMPTLACVLDNSSGQVIMPCIIDPTLAVNTLDSLNVAATLILLSLGGWTLQTARGTLWSQILSDPATATFSKVVQSRLEANPFAAVEADTKLIAGLMAALPLLQLKIPVADHVSPFSSMKAYTDAFKAIQKAETSLPALPSPFTVLDESKLFLSSNGMPVGMQSYQAPNLPSPSLTYFQLVNQDIIERIFLINYVDTHGTLTAQLGDTIVLAPGTSTGVMTVPLQTAADVYENIDFTCVSPTFNSDASTIDTVVTPAALAARTAAWERASVGLGADFIVCALGGTVASHNYSQLDAVIASLKQVNTAVSNGIAAADSGTDLPTCVSAFLFASAQTAQVTQSVIAALRVLSPNLPTDISTARLNQLRSLIRLGVSVGLQQLSSDYAQNYKAYIYVGAGSGYGFTQIPPSLLVDGTTAFRPSVSLSSNGQSLAPDGTPTTISVSIGIPALGQDFTPRLNGLLKYAYAFSGASNVTMSDGNGNSGNQFQSPKTTVMLVAQGMVTGPLVVTVEAFDVETGTDVSIGTASLTIDPTVTFSLDQTTYFVPANGQVTATVLCNGVAIESQWTGVQLNNLSFSWYSTFSDNAEIDTVSTQSNNYYSFQVDPTFAGSTGELTVTILNTVTGAVVKLTSALVYTPALKITPAPESLAAGGQATFTVSTQDGSALPANVSFQWAVSGAGSLGGSNSATTQVPSVSYTAPAQAESESLTVKMLNAQGTIIGAASASISVTAPVQQQFTEVIFTYPQYTVDGNGNNVDLTGYNGLALVVFTPPPGYSFYAIYSNNPIYVDVGPLILNGVYAAQLATPNVPVLVNGAAPTGSYGDGLQVYNLGQGQIGMAAGGTSYQALQLGGDVITPAQAQAMVIAQCQSLFNFYNPISLVTT